MPGPIKAKFIKRLSFFFNSRDIGLGRSRVKFVNFLYHKFVSEGRIKSDSVRFHLTSKFILDALSEFLKLQPYETLSLLKTKTTRITQPYRVDAVNLNYMHSRSIIHRLARKHKPEFKLTGANGSVLSPLKKNKVIRVLKGHSIGFSPLKLKNDNQKPLQRAESKDGSIFEEEIHTPDFSFWRKKSPTKVGEFTPSRIRVGIEFDSKSMGRLDFFDLDRKKDSTEYFSFTVSREDILARLGQKRGISQKAVMDNKTAKEVLEAIGVIMSENQNGRNFHWAHRQGFSLNGAQIKENLDPMPAGSNYATLFKVEQPLKSLLLDENSGVTEAFVKGEVDFDKHGLVDRVLYQISAALDITHVPIEVIIDAKNARIPTLEENMVAEKIMRHAFSASP